MRWQIDDKVYKDRKIKAILHEGHIPAGISRNHKMKEELKTKKQLTEELSALRQRLADLEMSSSHSDWLHEHYRLLFEGNADGYAAVDAEGFFIAFNSAFREMVGYAEAELKGMTYRDLSLEQWHDIEEKIIEEQISTESYSTLYEKEYRRKDGSVFPVELRTYLIKDINGAHTGLWAVIRDITDRKQAEKVLKASEERFCKAFQSSPAPTYISTISEGRYVDVNDSGLTLMDYNREEMIGHTVRELAVWFNYADRESLMEKLLKQGSLHNESISLRTKTGALKETLWSCEIIRLNGEDVMLSLLYDITERKQIEQALRESESVFRLLFEKSGDASLLIEAYRFIDCNEAALKILGCSEKSSLINLSPGDVSPERQPDGERSSEKAARMMAIAFNDGSNRFDWVHKKLDGTKALLDVILTPITIKGRKLIYTTWRDITAQKKAEEALKKSERLLADIIDFLPDATCVINVKGEVITWNRAMEEMSGVSKNDMIGQGDRAWLVPFYGERRSCLLDIMDSNDQDLVSKYQHVHRKGNVIYGEAFAPALNGGKGAYLWGKGAPLYDTDGSSIGAIESIRDITERKVIETQLRQAHKMEAIGTLAAGIAHDFNNILGGMIGYTEMSLLGIDTGNSLLRHYLEQIRRGIHRATDLVKQILTFSRQADQEMRPVRVTPLLKETLKLIRAAIPSHIKIIYNVDADRDLILADPTGIHQILMNICSNAAHAMREKGGILRIEITNLYLDGNNKITVDIKAGWYLRMTVSDTGPGIDENIIDRIFEPFFTTKKIGEGIGLGLAVVHGIVKKLGGDIIARGCPGEGTVFEIYLPLIEGKDNSIDNDQEKTYVGGKERILFVDDEDIMTRMAEEMLSKIGYDILATTSSVAALKSFRLRPDHFDIVITDQAMPDMTGMAMAEEMLKIRPDLPIILCTGFSEIVTRVQAEAIGIGGFIMKPFTMANLDTTIRKVLLRKT